MAGFIGFFNTNGTNETMDSMLKTIEHRGPDYRLDYSDDKLHLSYIGLDLNYSFDKKEIFEKDEFLVLLNGYVTNIDELRDYLSIKLNIDSSDMSPAQMIAAMYEVIELDELSNLIKGGYVVIIYNKNKQELVFIRDRFGVQPIFYYQTLDGLIFVSESKALLEHPDFKKELNKDALVPYLIFQSPVLKETFFKNVFTVDAASYMKYKDNEVAETRYWDVVFEEQEIGLEEASNKINEILTKSIESKVKYFNSKELIGQSLSGGVDSSYLAARFRPKKTFTVGYNDKEFSEIDNAKDLSKIIGAENFAEIVDSDKSFTEIDKIAYLCDMPFANLSAIPMYYLSKMIKEHTNSVMSGEGSDEFFGGYYEYTEPKYMNIYKAFPSFLRRAVGSRMLKNDKDFKGKNFMIKGLPTEDWYIGQAKIFHENEAFCVVRRDFRNAPNVKDITSKYFNEVKDKSDIKKKQYLDFHIWMINDIALKADRMNIGNSVQLVTPILDEDLLDFARTLPDNLKIDGNKVKIAFRNAAIKYLPDDWAKRKKKGYVVPLKNWLKEEKYSRVITEKLTGETAKKFFNVNILQQLIDENKAGKRAHHRKIWTVYMFLVWYEEYFIKR